MERLTIDEVIAHCQRHTDRVERSAAVLVFKEGNMPETAKKQYLEHKQVKEWLEELKEYKAAEEHGLLLRLPCKIGTTVYAIAEDCNGDYHDCNWRRCEICECLDRHIEEIGFELFMVEDMGKQIFLTEAEAEAALAKMKDIEKAKDNLASEIARIGYMDKEDARDRIEQALKQKGE